MRPRSFDPEAATETAVSDLLRRFDALTDPAPATTTGAVATTFTGPIESTFLVAASDARDQIKAVADYVCDGVDDHVEINAAWVAVQALNIGGGRVVLSAGTFTIRDKVTVNTDQGEPGVMIGAGQDATLIHMGSVTGSPAAAVRVRAGATIRDFSILVDGTATLTTGALELTEGDAQAFSIGISTDDAQGIWIKGPRSRVEACHIDSVTDGENGIFVHADAFDTILTGNHITQTRQHGIFIDGDAGGTPAHVQILGNRIVNPSRQTAATYDGIHMEGPFAGDHGPLIEGNIIYKTSGGDFRDGILVAATNVIDVTITGNTVGAGVGRWAINMDGVRSLAAANRLMGGIDVGGDDNHIEGNLVAVVNNASNGIVVGGDRNSIFDNKVFPQSGTAPAVGLEILSGATDNIIGINDLEQATTDVTDAGTGTIFLATGIGSSLTTKGDIHGYSTVDARLAVGTNGQIIVADSAQGLGIKWDDLGVWKTWTPTYTDITVGNGTVVARYVQVGNLVVARFELVFGSTSSIDSNGSRISMPVTAATGADTEQVYGPAVMREIGGSFNAGHVRAWDTSEFNVVVFGASATYATWVAISSIVPFTWGTGDVLGFTATYEAA